MANGDIGIGKLIDQERGRDAIHVAVAPVEAAYPLVIGSHICILENGKAGYGSGSIGIVDPFLTVAPKEGDRFYVFLYPGSIMSLRHEWVHPAFGNTSANNKHSAHANSIETPCMTVTELQDAQEGQ